MSTNQIALWTMIGAWFSGIATFSAVLASLHIANRKPKAHLTCKVGERIIIGKNALGESLNEDGLAITVVNQSAAPVKIVSVGWKLDKGRFFHQMLGDINSDSVPKRIEYGEQAFFWIKYKGDDWIEKFAEELQKRDVKIKKVRFFVGLSTGKNFYFKPEKNFLEKLERLNKP